MDESLNDMIDETIRGVEERERAERRMKQFLEANNLFGFPIKLAGNASTLNEARRVVVQNKVFAHYLPQSFAHYLPQSIEARVNIITGLTNAGVITRREARHYLGIE